jgi:hypothetical protein
MAKGRVMNKRTKSYVVRPDGNSRASLPIETWTYSRTDPLARDARQEAGKGKTVGTRRTGVTEEGAA